MGNEQMHTPTEEAEESGLSSTLAHPLALGGATFLTAGVVDLLAHLGPTGLVVGGIAAIVAARHGGDLYDQVRELFSTPPSQPDEQKPQPRSGRTLLDRTLGRFPEPASSREAAVLAARGEDELVKNEEENVTSWFSQRIRRGDLIDLAPNVQIDKSDLVGKAIFVCGIRRHGKTTLGARLAEQLGQHYIPLFIPCLEGDYVSLGDVLPRAIIAGHSSADAQYADYEFAAIDSAKAAYQLGYDMLELGYQVILDMASYAMLDQAVAIQINIIRGLFHWANTHPEQRVPCHVFLDEAQRYLPQSLSDSVILDKTVLGELLRAYMDIIAIGGKRGIAPVILTQRFAQVNKKIMAQSEVFFLMRQTNDGDLDRCMEYVNREVATKEHIARFKPGQGIYIAADGTQVVTQFHQRLSSGKRSCTPHPDAARRYASMPMRRPNTTVPEQEHPNCCVPAETPQATPAKVEPAQPEPPLLARAVNAYLEGATSQPKLAAALKISAWDARKLMPEVEAEVKRLRASEPS